MNNQVIPSKDPADDGHLAGVFATVERKILQRIDGQLPCVVLGYNRTTNRAIVQPLINVVATSGGQTPRAQIASVPVLALGGGGFCINFPLKAGDKGWIEASDRDISLFLQSGGSSKPNTFRMHSFEDGRFIPDAFHGYSFDSVDVDSMVIQSYDGTVKIALRAHEMKITTPTLKVLGNVEITGNLTTTGNVANTGTLENNDVDVGSTHVHFVVGVGTDTLGPGT